MSTLTARRAQVNRNACVLLFAPSLIRRRDAFGLGVFPTKTATENEAARHFAETTYSADEKRAADRFNLTLAEVRGLLAEGENAIRDAEFDRLQAWDDVNEAHARGDDVITIADRAYAVCAIDAGEFGSAAYRLTKGDGTRYDVLRDHDGLIRCDCPDYTFRHEGTDGVCKHGRALIGAGKISGPSPKSVPVLIAGVSRVRDEFDEAASR